MGNGVQCWSPSYTFKIFIKTAGEASSPLSVVFTAHECVGVREQALCLQFAHFAHVAQTACCSRCIGCQQSADAEKIYRREAEVAF